MNRSKSSRRREMTRHRIITIVSLSFPALQQKKGTISPLGLWCSGDVSRPLAVNQHWLIIYGSSHYATLHSSKAPHLHPNLFTLVERHAQPFCISISLINGIWDGLSSHQRIKKIKVRASCIPSLLLPPPLSSSPFSFHLQLGLGGFDVSRDVRRKADMKYSRVASRERTGHVGSGFVKSVSILLMEKKQTKDWSRAAADGRV